MAVGRLRGRPGRRGVRGQGDLRRAVQHLVDPLQLNGKLEVESVRKRSRIGFLLRRPGRGLVRRPPSHRHGLLHHLTPVDQGLLLLPLRLRLRRKRWIGFLIQVRGGGWRPIDLFIVNAEELGQVFFCHLGSLESARLSHLHTRFRIFNGRLRTLLALPLILLDRREQVVDGDLLRHLNILRTRRVGGDVALDESEQFAQVLPSRRRRLARRPRDGRRPATVA